METTAVKRKAESEPEGEELRLQEPDSDLMEDDEDPNELPIPVASQARIDGLDSPMEPMQVSEGGPAHLPVDPDADMRTSEKREGDSMEDSRAQSRMRLNLLCNLVHGTYESGPVDLESPHYKDPVLEALFSVVGGEPVSPVGPPDPLSWWENPCSDKWWEQDTTTLEQGMPKLLVDAAK